MSRSRLAAHRAALPALALGVLVALAVLGGGSPASAVPAPASARASATSTAPAAGVPAPAHGVWPLQPRPDVVARFDPPSTRWGAGHRGVDLAGRVGQPVHAALGGVVTYAGRLAGRGVVVVDHGTTRTTYEPVGAGLRVGDRVAAGAVLGRLQLFGSHCFPRACLHWGLIEGRDHYLDPLTLVVAPVRLLPLTGRVLTWPGDAWPGDAWPGGAGPQAAPGPAALPAVAALAGPVAEPPLLAAAQARGWAWR